MKILIASIPAPGHLNPLLSIASLLVESGHEVAVQVNEDLRPAVEAAGHRFLSKIPNAQTSGRYFLENYMAISHGIPVISAGLSEDKEEVSAHVQWSGAGIDLRANQATPWAIKHAVEEIYTQPRYRERAQQLALEFASHDVKAELLSLIEGCVPDTVNA